MGIERVTPRPAFYADEPEAWELEALEKKAEETGFACVRDQFCFTFSVGHGETRPLFSLSSGQRCRVAQVIADALQEKMVFDRMENCYFIGDWSVTCTHICSGMFTVNERQGVLPVLDRLNAAGYVPDGGVTIRWVRSRDTPGLIFAVMELFEREGEFLRQLFQSDEELYAKLNPSTLDLRIPGERLSAERMNQALLIYRRMISYAERVSEEAEVLREGWAT